MGLDISWYRDIREAPDGDPGSDYAHYFMACVNSHYPERAGQVKHGVVYTFAEKKSFRAGTYSGYNEWREELAKFAGYPAVSDPTRERHPEPRHDAGAWAADGGPFWELIHFSDCEGIIGAPVAAKLAKDFADHAERAAAFGDDWWRQLYALWRNAFEKAADNGAVDFH